MFTPRNLITVLLLLGVGALGWVGGSRSAQQNGTAALHEREAIRPPAAADNHREKDAHTGHNHGVAQDEHAGHDRDPGSGELCPEHRLPEAEDVLCNPGLMSTLLPGEGVKLRLATPEAAARAGIVMAPAQRTAMAGGPAIPARISYDRGRLAEVMALSGGTLRRLVAEPGQRVGQGALLAEIASPGAALAQGDHQAALGRLQLAEANVRREQELVARGVSPRIELEQAEAELAAAKAAAEQLRAQLAAFGAPPSGTGSLLALRSPVSGTVVARNAVTGQTLAPETSLFTVADLSSMWLELQLTPEQLALAKTGTPIEAEIDGLPGRRFPGRIVQVGAALDERTRLLRVVAEVANPDGQLKDGMFGTVHLVAAEATTVTAAERADHHGAKGASPQDVGDDHGHTDHDDHDGHTGKEAHKPAVTVAVPAAAVQAIDGKSYVFVALERDLFELRRVEAGPRRAGKVLIVAGLGEGEQVAASQGFALKSELLKSRLGASCADH